MIYNIESNSFECDCRTHEPQFMDMDAHFEYFRVFTGRSIDGINLDFYNCVTLNTIEDIQELSEWLGPILIEGCLICIDDWVEMVHDKCIVIDRSEIHE